MWTRQNKTRLWEWEYAIQKPMANNVTIRNWLFVSLVDWYIVPADWTLEIEGCAINDRFSGENNEHRYCIYQPRRDWETFTMEVDNWTIKQEDVWKTFRITSGLQHINYSTKSEVGGQFRLEEVLSPTLGTFTYNKATQFAPQGPQGNDGQTPNLQIWTVAKLQPDANPTAQLVQDPDDPTMYTLNLWIPAWATGPKWAQGETGANGRNWRDWVDGQDWQNGDEWEPGEPGVSPKWKGDRTGGTIYYYLNMVRYPDTDNVYWTWVWDYLSPSTGTEVPGVHANWKKMNRDWETWPQGDQGSIITIPVEWKPGKDGIWVNGKDWKDWNSPHDEWDWSNTKEYWPLSMVRAFTGDYDERGNEIRWYYITNNGSYGNDPQLEEDWQLVAKDWKAREGNPYCAMVGLGNGIERIWRTFNVNWNLPTETWNFDVFTGNRAMVTNSGAGIQITKTGHYRIFWHCIVQANTWANQYINLWRYSIMLVTWRSGNTTAKFIATSKMWGPVCSANEQWPWFDFHIDIQADLYEWDILTSIVRLQSDDPDSYNTSTGTFRIIGADDTSWDDPNGQYIWGFFPTYMWVEYISRHTWQENDPEKMVWDI